MLPEPSEDRGSAIVRENVERETRVHTDESNLYNRNVMDVRRAQAVKHTAGEYVSRRRDHQYD